MIIVTGTKRSGTSLWMQILQAAGFPTIASPFSLDWEQSIQAANPRGFFESPLRQGVFYATNPNPATGDFLFPEVTRTHAVKVFIPGLVRTDYAFIHRVVGTLRHWRDYTASLDRLHTLEAAYYEATGDALRLAAVELARTRFPGPVDWWLENYELIRDIATRKYPVNLSTYDRLLEDPEAVLGRVFDWLGEGDLAAALTAVAPELRTKTRPEVDTGEVLPEHLSLMDEVFDAVHRTQSLPPALLGRMNEVHEAIVEQFGRTSLEREREDLSSDA